MLQWGRDLAVAETPPYRGPTSPSRRFNGAATSRSRRHVVEPRAGGVLLKLQWGRALAVAETIMGTDNKVQNRKLQWGRALAVAETSRWRPICRCTRPASMGPRPRGRGDD